MTRVLVFTRTKHSADKVAEFLRKSGDRVDAIHGNKSQNSRQNALEGFRRGRSRILVATTSRRAASTSTMSRTSSTWIFPTSPKAIAQDRTHRARRQWRGRHLVLRSRRTDFAARDRTADGTFAESRRRRAEQFDANRSESGQAGRPETCPTPPQALPHPA